ncbi:hypothetical protein FOA52_003162 [Chlamydomonas sp. UWO 241]|nr:hypothetical protein FOA52_003162 [Chlamydomonas sp. UWO 241]
MILRMSLSAQRPSSLGKPCSTSKLGFRPLSSGRALRVPPLLRATPDIAREASQEEARRGGPPMRPGTEQDQSHEAQRTPSHEDRVAAALLAAEGLAKTAVTLATREHAQAGGEELTQLMRAVAMRLDAASPPGQQDQQQDQVTRVLESLAGSSQRTETLLSDILAAAAAGADVAVDWGRAYDGKVGVVRSVKEDKGICFIEYPEVNSCLFRRLNEIEVVSKGSEREEEEEEEERPIAFGTLVRTPLSLPHMGAMGIVTALREDASATVKLPFFGEVDFDVNKLVVVPLAPGMRVRVRRDCYNNFEIWGDLDHDSVGVVVSVEEDGDFIVDFPGGEGGPGWTCTADELQVVIDDEVEMEGEEGEEGKEESGDTSGEDEKEDKEEDEGEEEKDSEEGGEGAGRD